MNIFWWKCKNFPYLARGYARVFIKRLIAIASHSMTYNGRLNAKLIKADGKVYDLGLISINLVTDAFVNFLVDQLQAETTEFGDFKFHDSGIGTTGENVTDTTLETKVETGRVTGSQLEGASVNIYKTVGTITYTATRAITEHGVFSITAVGTMMDRSVFAAINVLINEKVEFTYELTCTAGG